MTSPDQKSLRAELRERFPRDRGQLLPALHYVHDELTYLPDWAMEVVGWHLGVPASEVYGAATSYSELRIAPPPQRLLKVCTGISCVVNGGRELLATLREAMPDDDGGIGLEETPCAFMCGVAPVVEWNGRWHGRVSAASVDELIFESASV